VTRKCYYFWWVVKNVIGGVPTVLGIRLMYILMTLGKILLQGSVSTNLLDSGRHEVDIRPIAVETSLLENIYVFGHVTRPDFNFAPRFGPRLSFSIRILC
jgi:hypothetical protein